MKFYEDSNSVERYRFRRIFHKKNLVKAILFLLAAALLAGYLYENYEAKQHLDAYEGKTITVNQVTYNYQVVGSGDYTVIVDGAAGESELSRKKLVEAFDGKARLFFYDRPGYGGTKGEYKTPKEVAEDLHFIFRRFGWKMEFILMGEEYGSLVMQEYLHLYPEEVLGAVFLNPMGEALGSSEMARYEGIHTASFPSKEGLGIFGIPRALQNAGILDFFDHVDLPEEEKSMYANLRLSKDFMAALKTEYQFMTTGEQLPVKPMLLEDKPFALVTTKLSEERYNQEKYLSYSSDSSVFYVQDSVRDILLERPKDVAPVLYTVVDKVIRRGYNK